MRHLNDDGVCLLTDVPTDLGQMKKVHQISISVMKLILIRRFHVYRHWEYKPEVDVEFCVKHSLQWM